MVLALYDDAVADAVADAAGADGDGGDGGAAAAAARARLARAAPLLERELAWWAEHRAVVVAVAVGVPRVGARRRGG